METRMTGTGLPLAGVRVVEMTHMVMGPTCGMILAQLGADVIKVEPPAGDKTRSLGGMGTSFFPLFNRGKRSVVLDFGKEEDRETMDRLLASADVFLENFRDGQLEKQGLGADELRRKYPHLYCWTQGLSIRPLRASPGPRRSRADDVGPRRHDRHQRKTAAGRFVGERHHGRHVRGDLDSRSALPETQRCHGRRYSYRVVRKLPVPGGPAHGRVRGDRREAALDARTRARLADLRYFRDRGRRTHFHRRRHRRPLAEFCREFCLSEFLDDPNLRTTTDRILARSRIIPRVTEVIKHCNAAELSAKLDRLNICFSPINRPEDLFDDPHVLRPGGLVNNVNANGESFRVPALPIEWNGASIGEGLRVPALGADTS